MPSARSVFAVYERVAGTILAAGSSSGLGRPTRLLDSQGRPGLRAVAEAALAAGLAPVQVVTGEHADAVAAALNGLPVTLVHNHAWREGQAASIRAAVAALPANTGATVFVPADQPARAAGVDPSPHRCARARAVPCGCACGGRRTN